MREPILFFGPERNTPSWRWVGGDVAAHLASSMDVRVFQDESQLPHDAIVFWIKAPPNESAVDALRRKRAQVIFFPIDAFHSVEEIEAASAFLNLCRLIVLHSPSLAAFFDPAKVRHIDHYNKYGISPAKRRPGRALLWIGGFQYAPYILRFLLETPLPASTPVILLSDAGNPAAINAAQRLALELGLDKTFGPHMVSGYASLVEWSEARQRLLLEECRAAFDIKDTSNFNQLHKPPTKLQKFLCSGIPTAVNTRLPLLGATNIAIPDPADATRWLSAEFEMAVRHEGVRLRPSLTLSNVTQRYIALAAELQSCRMPSLQ